MFVWSIMSGKANILIVDDEIGPRESLKMVLKPYYNIYMADKGALAVKIIEQTPIDLVTLDLKMPGYPGTKVLEKVKQHDPDIEAIIITGYGSLDTAVDGLRLDAFDYISKPFDVNHMLDLVRRGLARRNAKLKLKQIKTDFMANVSHELRTPLTAVVGFVSLLLDQFLGPLSNSQLKVLRKVYKNAEELLELIDNLLCLTSLNSGDLSVVEEEFDIEEMIHKNVQQYEKVLEKKGVNLSLQLPTNETRILSDPSKVTLIFQNLLHNAIKFTLKGQITVKMKQSVNREITYLEIVDTGIGIPPEEIKTLFKPFRQLDSSSRRDFSGLGVGLAVARKLTDLIGGTLEIRSQPNNGTHVLLGIPSGLAACRESEVQATL